MAGWQTARTRARDADRDAACRALDNAFSEGQLAMDEHRRRIDAAISAATLAELHELLDDLQIDDPLPQPVSPRRRRRGIGLAIAGALVVVVAAIGWVLASPDTPVEPPNAAVPQAPAAPAAITPAPPPPIDDVPPVVLKLPRHMDTVEGMTGLLDEIRKRFGSTMGYELALRPDQAYLSLPDPADDGRKLIYTYRGGWGSPSGSARSDSDIVADLSAVDIAATVAAWLSAPATLQIAPDDVEDSYLDIDHIEEPGGPGALETLIRVTTKSGKNGFLYLDPSGAIKRVENPS
ncbi:DUF1707 domain-containing protein [Mycolicibacterium sp. P9-22]|uniref:DUF1707 SHOCT-like domain-containing protein n=1 Tax=Mycolicibacterium sp. P9-22 TaxID=2024613 RepID=UPI0018847948|nr:DUF1707 domain-containing protein [Mycolicibacterium sp. P9-22]